MNKLFLRIAFMAAFATALSLSQTNAQTFINYQASIQKPDGNNKLIPIPDGEVTAVVTIFKDATFSNTSIYQETHKSVAVKNGLVNFQIGTGARSFTSDFYSNIKWNIDKPYYVKIDYFSGPNIVITGSMQPLSSVPYANSAANAQKADTAKVALKIAGLENDVNGKFAGAVQVFGMNEGAAIIKGSDWQRVTRTCYDHIENLFGSNGHMNLKYNLPAAGTRREYYLVIRKGDGVKDCAGTETLGRNAMGSEWRFYLSWKNKAGHKFQLGRNWGGNDDGSLDWVKIPQMSSYPDFGHPMYWHLEARINPNCPASNMKVHSIHVVAFDKIITSPNDTVAVNIDSDNKLGKESTYEFGIKGGIVINPSREVSVYNALTIIKEKEFRIDVGTKLAGVTNPSGVVYYEVVGSESHVFGGNILSDDSQNHGLGTTNHPFAHAYIRGLTRTGVLEITGGDVAEARHSTTGEQLPKGSVVVFDANEKGKVRLTNKPYDRKVAGVISGAGKYYAGVTLLQEELQKGAMPVAQIGTVEVLTIGPVEVGDLLTTSEVEGYAKVANDAIRGIGCVIGKATTTLKEGERGLVEMQIEKH
jgi:hypothetical protein